MVFSEPTFLFFFLPLCLAVYFFMSGLWRNHVLLFFSFVFYAWGDALHFLALLTSIAVNYGFGLAIARALAGGGSARGVLALGLAANLTFLGWFKYLGFFLDNLGVANAHEIAPDLPIGISFFTFQALSYLIDLQGGRIAVQTSPWRLALYISMFPQLVAGPIVRYMEVEGALKDRHVTRDDIAAGTYRFVIGLAKKTLIADPAGLTADRVFAIPEAGLGPGTAWLGVAAYTIQIYFDFSAYSDMAIGLGRMFGFRFPENFDYPYVARSVTEFWRRWHMTLSRWFRDYLYIPLGGNRAGVARTYVNLGIVFLATGLWHGAAWTFVFWGAWHGAFLILERMFLRRWLDSAPAAVAHVYLLLVVMLGWVAFRAETFSQAFDFYGAMILGRTGEDAGFYPLARYVDGYILTVLVIGAIGSVPVLRRLVARAPGPQATSLVRGGRVALLWLLFLAAVVSVGAASYSPFIYFRF